MKPKKLVWCGRIQNLVLNLDIKKQIPFAIKVGQCTHITPAGKCILSGDTRGKGQRPCIGVEGVFTPNEEAK